MTADRLLSTCLPASSPQQNRTPMRVSPHECCRPKDTLAQEATPAGADTAVGTGFGVVEAGDPVPSWPSEPRPVERNTSIKLLRQHTHSSACHCRPLLAPRPLNSPQQKRLRVLGVSAHVWYPPVATAAHEATPEEADTGVGTVIVVVLPIPSWPSILFPANNQTCVLSSPLSRSTKNISACHF